MTTTLLTADEPGPFELIDGPGAAPIVFVCDHASNRIPAALGDLGLASHHRRDHIAWDIGAAAVARRLRERFDAGAVLAGYSRLVIDLNRRLTDRSAIPEISDGVLISGNLGIDDAEREARARALYHPYHDAVDALIERRTTASEVPIFLGIHSFTSRFHGTTRPWQIGVLWDRDPRLAIRLLEALRAESGILVADNEPYSGRHPADFSIDRHAELGGLAHAGIEIRQDLIADEAGQARWADILGRALETAAGASWLYRRQAAGGRRP